MEYKGPCECGYTNLGSKIIASYNRFFTSCNYHKLHMINDLRKRTKEAAAPTSYVNETETMIYIFNRLFSNNNLAYITKQEGSEMDGKLV